MLTTSPTTFYNSYEYAYHITYNILTHNYYHVSPSNNLEQTVHCQSNEAIFRWEANPHAFSDIGVIKSRCWKGVSKVWISCPPFLRFEYWLFLIFCLQTNGLAWGEQSRVKWGPHRRGSSWCKWRTHSDSCRSPIFRCIPIANFLQCPPFVLNDTSFAEFPVLFWKARGWSKITSSSRIFPNPVLSWSKLLIPSGVGFEGLEMVIMDNAQTVKFKIRLKYNS